MIYCVWYPSGGFGHFINAVLTLHGENFARPKKQQYSFSSSGDSHQLELAAPKFFKNPNNYSFDFDSTLNYSVLSTMESTTNQPCLSNVFQLPVL
jgi:hypothetical protein